MLCHEVKRHQALVQLLAAVDMETSKVQADVHSRASLWNNWGQGARYAPVVISSVISAVELHGVQQHSM